MTSKINFNCLPQKLSPMKINKHKLVLNLMLLSEYLFWNMITETKWHDNPEPLCSNSVPNHFIITVTRDQVNAVHDFFPFIPLALYFTSLHHSLLHI